MVEKLQGRNGEMRLYDSTATPLYFVVIFHQMDTSGPIGRKRPDEELQLDRETMTTNSHYLVGSDEVLMAPLEVTFSASLDDTHNLTDLELALQCTLASWITTKGDTSLTNRLQASVTTPGFGDATKKCVNIEALWDAPTDKGYQWNEVYFSPDQIEVGEAAGEVILNATGQVYGTILPITAFTAGSES